MSVIHELIRLIVLQSLLKKWPVQPFHQHESIFFEIIWIFFEGPAYKDNHRKLLMEKLPNRQMSSANQN